MCETYGSLVVGEGLKPHLLARRTRRTGLDWPGMRGRSPQPRRWVELASCCIMMELQKEPAIHDRPAGAWPAVRLDGSVPPR